MIYHEKQEGSLCGLHCINNALQSKLFNPVDLSQIANQLDEKERQTMAELGTDTEEYRTFLNKPSINYDDSGYFSVQVLTQAFKNFDIDLIHYNGKIEEVQAFIVHFEDHWFCIRKFGNDWYNLNSNLEKPEIVTESYLELMLQSMENASIYVLIGDLPECEYDVKTRGQRLGGRSSTNNDIRSAREKFLSQFK